MLRVANKATVLSVVMLNVVMPSVVAPFFLHALKRGFIIYDIYSPKRDSKRLTWHYCLSLMYTKRARDRERDCD
jgi:hypothetical protein